MVDAIRILPVIHYLDLPTAFANAEIALSGRADGVFVISMDGHDRDAWEAARAIKARHPDLLVGCNHLACGPWDAVRADLDGGLDMTWSDAPGISGTQVGEEAVRVAAHLRGSPHRFFASVAFKYQEPEPNPPMAACRADHLGFIATTSGPATGQPADIEKLRAMRLALGDRPLAIASGVTPENVRQHVGLVDHILVSTGISASFHVFDPRLLADLVARARA